MIDYHEDGTKYDSRCQCEEICAVNMKKAEEEIARISGIEKLHVCSACHYSFYDGGHSCKCGQRKEYTGGIMNP